MKTLIAVLTIALPLIGGTINLNSDLTNEFNTLGSNIHSPLHPAWDVEGADYEWVTCAGCYNNFPVASIPGPPTVTFYETFNTTPGIWSGSVRVWADDTTTVLLDGIILAAANPTQTMYCAEPPGCQPGKDISVPLLITNAGPHTLEFGVSQRVANTPFGLMYDGSISEVPEPGTFLAVGLGLLVVGWRFKS